MQRSMIPTVLRMMRGHRGTASSGEASAGCRCIAPRPRACEACHGSTDCRRTAQRAAVITVVVDASVIVKWIFPSRRFLFIPFMHFML